MRALTVFAAAAAAGLASGAASHLASAPVAASARVSLAAFTAYGVAVCLAAAVPDDGTSMRARAGRAAAVAAGGSVAGWLAVAVAGDAAAVGSAAIVGAAALLAFGVASLLRARGAGEPHSILGGAAVPVAFAAIVFVADPFVEWNGSYTTEAPGRAAALIALDPLASIAGDAGYDWQRSRWMYEGPGAGSPGLSVIGRYYPSRATPPFVWSGGAAAAGLVALALATLVRKARAAPGPADGRIPA